MTNSEPNLPSERPRDQRLESLGQLVLAPADAGQQTSASGSPGGNGGIGRYLHSMRRRFVLATALGLLLAGLAAFAAFFLTQPKYTSTAYLRVLSRQDSLLDQEHGARSPSDFSTYQRTQRQYITNPFVLSAALRDPNVAKLSLIRDQADPVAWLRENVAAKFPDDAEIMEVKMSGTDAKGIAAIVNAVVDAYMREVVDAEASAQRTRLSNLERAYSETEVELRSKRSQLKQLVDTLGTGDNEALSVKQQNALQYYGVLRTQLTQVQFDLMQSQGELAVLSGAVEVASLDGATQDGDSPANASDEVGSEVVASEQVQNEDTAATRPEPEIHEDELESVVQSDAIATSLWATIQQHEAQLKHVHDSMQPAAAERVARRQRDEISRLQTELSERRDWLAKEMLRQRTAASAGRRRELQNRVAVLTHQEQRLRDELEQVSRQTNEVGRSSIDVEMMRMEISSLDDVLRRLGGEIEQAKLDLKSESRVTFFSRAQPPDGKDRQRQIAMTILGALGGLFLGVGVVTLSDAQRRHISDSAELSRELNWDVIGTLPVLPRRVLANLSSESKANQQWRRTLDEAVASVVALVLRKAQLERKRVILVSSAQAGEGKTTLSGQLAIGLAEAGKRAVVIDFDLRRPSLDETFHLRLVPGVSEVLCDECDLESAIQSTSYNNLSFIAAGDWIHSPLNRLTPDRMEALFRQLRERYDFVIVDGSPILTVVDTRLIAQYVDGVVLSVLRDVSQVAKLLAARDVLTAYDVPFLGAVVIGQTKADAYYGDYHRDRTVDLETVS